MYKQFDKGLYALFDKKARETVKKVLKDQNLTITDNPDQYGPDLIVYDKDKMIGYIECEIKRVWDKPYFPYESVQFPERKRKFLAYKDITFYMFNLGCTKGLRVKGEDVLKSPTKEVSNVYIERGERFFQVPLDKVEFFDV